MNKLEKRFTVIITIIMLSVSAVSLYADNKKEVVKLPLTKLMKEADKLIKKCSKKDPALQQVLIKDAEEQDIDKPRPKVNELYKGLTDLLKTLEDELADDTLNKLADAINPDAFTDLDVQDQNRKEGDLYDEVEKGKIKQRTGVREIIKVKIKTKTEITETEEGTTTDTTTETEETSYEEPYEMGDDDDDYGYDDYEY